MRTRNTWIGITSVGALLLGSCLVFAQDDQAPPAAPEQPGITVEARGPVHEAFASPSTPDAQPGIIVPKQPPDPIPEQPPDVKPEGDNVKWIPGYWAWDADKGDFLWVSGFWRNMPPDRRWVPGYWTQVANGWQWVPGFWADANQQELSYLPQPPASLDNGPDTPAPDANSIYVPGCWIYGNSGYAWRPGYWLQSILNWLWTPAHYCWTPSGYVYVSGYWDYPLVGRGSLFCPVSFTQPLWTNPNWYFTPQYTVGIPALLGSLWVQPAYCHYFFGNYYGSDYRTMSLQPWLRFGPRYHDSLFNYYNWKGGPGWYRSMNSLFVGRQRGTLVRPAMTLAAQNNLFRNTDITNIQNRRRLAVVNRFGAGSTGMRLGHLNGAELGQQRLHAQNIQQLRGQRLRAEGRTAAGERRSEGPHPFRLPPAANAHLGNGIAHPGRIAPSEPSRVAPRELPHPGRPAGIAPHLPGSAAHGYRPGSGIPRLPTRTTPRASHAFRPAGPVAHAPAGRVNRPAPHLAAPRLPARTARHAAPARPAPHPVARPAPRPAPHPAPRHR